MRKWRKPHLDILLDLGFLTLETMLMRQRYERNEFDYICLQWRFFKWQGRFRLYKVAEYRY